MKTLKEFVMTRKAESIEEETQKSAPENRKSSKNKEKKNNFRKNGRGSSKRDKKLESRIRFE